MTERAQTILTVAMSAYTAGWLTGLFVGGLAHRGWRRPMQPPRGSYGGSLRLIQVLFSAVTATVPQQRQSRTSSRKAKALAPVRHISVGYQDGPINPPPRNP